jgi:Transposase DDE domain/Transposase domain (DUF772)
VRILTTDPLFAWDRLEDNASLAGVRQFFDLLPEEKLLEALRQHRGKGRNDCPMHVLWRIHVTRYLLRHVTMEACLAELERNAALRKVVGIETGMKIPRPWNMSRFLEVLGLPQHLSLLKEMFVDLTRRLASAVPDLGQHLAGDSASLNARKDRDGAASSLPQPDGGCKEYTDDSGKVVRTFEWFGYKFHLLVDVKHEVILDYVLTPATTGDSTLLPQLLAGVQQVLPEGRIKTLAYDKAADNHDTHKLLARHSIKPLIEIRNLWKNQTEELLSGHDGNSNVVHDEAGTLYCYDKVSTIPCKHKMAYIGHEKSRGTLKYRCPARHEGWACPSDKRCNGCSAYGKTVRVKCELDLRRFPPIPRATKEFERRYNGRTSVERINARVKLFWGADDGNVTGAARFHAHLCTIMLVHSGFANLLAMADRYEGKSLSPVRLSVIARHLRGGVTHK